MRNLSKRCTATRRRHLSLPPIYNRIMANLTLVYGMRLLPADEIVRVGDAPIELKNGNQAQVTMHVLEGSREQIEAQLKMSLDAFFDFYPEI
jgi:hypothetical protein